MKQIFPDEKVNCRYTTAAFTSSHQSMELRHVVQLTAFVYVQYTYPVILEYSTSLRVILSAEDISKTSSTEELITKIKAIAE